MRFLDKLERKIGRFAVKNLILYIVVANAIVFLVDFIFANTNVKYLLVLTPYHVLNGEFWRLITFNFVPSGGSILSVAISLYFYYIIGLNLEYRWGAFRLNVYYIIGALATIIGSFATGYAMTAQFIFLSLFLAYAKLAPDVQILLFFVIPVKVKWLGWLAWIMIAYNIVTSPAIALKILQLTPAVNYLLFFGGDIFRMARNNRKAHINKTKFQVYKGDSKDSFHKCSICGITDKDDPDMDFRYCSKCNGDYEYCMNHLSEHVHKE